MIVTDGRNAARIVPAILGSLLLLGSAFIALSLLLAIFPLTLAATRFAYVGNLLFGVYGYSSFLVPLFFLSAAILMLLPLRSFRSACLLGGSVVPFFTVVAAERLYAIAGLAGSSSSFAQGVSIAFALTTLLAVAVEYILLSSLVDRLRRQLDASPALVKVQQVQQVQPVQMEEEWQDEPEAQVEIEVQDEALAEPESEETIEDVPEYIDFEKMRAPFDLPQSQDWVEPSATQESVPHPEEPAFEGEIDFSEEEALSELEAFESDDADEEEDLLDEDEIVDEEEILDEDEKILDEEELVDEENSADEELCDELAGVECIHGTPSPSVSEPKVALLKKKKTYEIPYEVLNTYPDGEYWIIDEATRRSAAALKETLNEFHIQADVTGIRKGPVITMFEILPAPGVKLSKIVGLQDNIALRLAASSVRIVAPIPGKHAVGIEVPNQRRAIVSFREIIENDSPQAKKMEIPVVLGKDITGEAQLLDLAATPHLLIAGSTGSGKSVCVNSIILSILYKRSPEDVKLILIDPKIVELKLYNDIGHLLAPVITEPKKAFQSLQYCLCEMERRYALLDGMGVRDIRSYNHRIKERKIATEKIPYLVVIIDEFADLMATTGKELESTVARLCAMSRAVGIHLVLATQRPSIDVITGLIKANIPTRIAFMVASKMDSRIIIDQVGAEKLLGRGDMLYASATDPFPVRIQGAYVSEEEVERVVEHVKTLGEPEYIDEEIFVDDEDDSPIDASLFSDGDDPLYDKALEIVMLAGKASASYIQRKLKIGYNRAARLVEEMEQRGIVGPANGSKPRDVIHHV